MGFELITFCISGKRATTITPTKKTQVLKWLRHTAAVSFMGYSGCNSSLIFTLICAWLLCEVNQNNLHCLMVLVRFYHLLLNLWRRMAILVLTQATLEIKRAIEKFTKLNENTI